MITAKLKYRDYVPFLTYAVEFADIDFYGNSKAVELLNVYRDLKKFQNYDKTEIKIDFLKAKLEENRSKEKQIIEKIRNLKKKYKITILFKDVRKEIKELEKTKSKLYYQDYEIRKKIEQLDDARFLSTSQEIDQYRDMLNSLGFSCKSTLFQDHNSISIEHYECQKTDDEIIEVVKSKITYFKEQLNKEVEKVKKQIEECKNSKENTLDF